MKIAFNVFISFLTLITIVESKETSNKFDKFYSNFTNISIDDSLVFAIEDYTIQKDIGTIRLSNGNIYFCSAFENRVYSAVFIGEGEFDYTPPNKIEQNQLFRFFEIKNFKGRFNKLFLLFSDSTYFELTKKAAKRITSNTEEAANFAEESIQYFLEEDYSYIEGDFTKTILDESYNRYFSAQIETYDEVGTLDKGERLFYTINPFNIEDVSLSHGKSRLGHYWQKVINQFKSSNHLDDYNFNLLEKKGLNISKYTIDNFIDNGLDYSAKAQIDFNCIRESQKWIYFTLYQDLEVDSIIWNDGTHANFTREDEGWQIWIKLKENYTKPQSVSIYYHGDLLERLESYWIHLRSISNWFPKYGKQNSVFDITFKFPSKLKLACVGEKKSSKILGDFEISRWISAGKLKDASFSLGSYKEYILETDDHPDIYIYQTKGNKARYGFDRGMDEEVGEDILNSVRYFDDYFGKPNFKNLYICEHLYNHGQAFPGFINLAWSTFASTDIHGTDRMFRAHEVAHQWWGIGVKYKTYHDQWLSEGFSTYSGLMYYALTVDDSEKIFDILDDWQEEIVNNRKYLLGSGQEAGPVWLGYRTESEDTEGDYNLIIYKKGAWVLHMLRNMMIDLKTFDEDLFKNMMRDYYKSFNGKQATTEDFIGICNKHFGMDMQWFFNQWVYGTDVPKYKFTYDYNKTENNKYLVKCKVEQKEVQNNFTAYIPLLIKFDDDRKVRIRVKVSGGLSEFNLPLLPLEPEEIIFNDLNSVLCDFEYVDWDEI